MLLSKSFFIFSFITSLPSLVLVLMYIYNKLHKYTKNLSFSLQRYIICAVYVSATIWGAIMFFSLVPDNPQTAFFTRLVLTLCSTFTIITTISVLTWAFIDKINQN